MAAFCARHGYGGRTPAEVLVDRLRPHLLTGAAGTVASKSTAAMFIDQLELLNQQVRSLTKHIDQRLACHPDAEIFLSLIRPGFRSYRFPCPAVTGWAESRSA